MGDMPRFQSKNKTTCFYRKVAFQYEMQWKMKADSDDIFSYLVVHDGGGGVWIKRGGVGVMVRGRPPSWCELKKDRDLLS